MGAKGRDEIEENASVESEQLLTGFIKASTLVKQSDEPSTQFHETSPTSTQCLETDSSTSNNPTRTSSFTTTTTHVSDSEGGQPLQPTDRSLNSTSSSSSLISDPGDNGDQKLRRILTMVEDWADQCSVCWARRDSLRPHSTWRCPTKLCSTQGWKDFKANLQFTKGTVCYFCLCPYGPPFNHRRAPPNAKQTADYCDHSDVLKQLIYVLYRDKSLRSQVFTKLGVAEPSGMYLYKKFISQKQRGDILGVYLVINAYLELRESGELSV